MTRLLGRDPRLWVCEHCGLLLGPDRRPAPPEWVAEAYPEGSTRPAPQDVDYQAHRRWGVADPARVGAV
jgi:hypothetical protein